MSEDVFLYRCLTSLPTRDIDIGGCRHPQANYHDVPVTQHTDAEQTAIFERREKEPPSWLTPSSQ